MNSLTNNNSMNFLDWGKSNALLLILLFLCIAVGVNFPNFFTASNWSLILQSSVLAGVMAIGLSFVMISGGFDLSFAATMLFTGSVAARLMMGDNPNPYFAAIAAPMVGAIIGIINGSIVVLSGVSPLIGTIANSFIIRAIGVLYVMETWMEIPVEYTSFLFIGQGSIYGLPFSVYIFIFIIFLSYIILNHSKYGKALYASGANPKAAHVAGIHVKRTQIIAYGICGFCAGVSGVINVSSVGGLSAVFNVSYLYDVITIAVVGGVSFFGGVGSIYGIVLGILVIGVLKNAMIIMNMPHYTQNAVGGLFLIFAIGIDSYLQKIRGK